MKKVEEFITWFFWNLFSDKVNDLICWTGICLVAAYGGYMLGMFLSFKF